MLRGRPDFKLLETWQPAVDGRNAKEAPIKDRDHAMDPIRYMVMKLDQGRGGGLAIPGLLPMK